MKAESGGYVNKTSFKVYISGAPAGHGTAAPGIGRQPKHEIPESGLSRIAGRRAAPVIVRPDTAAAGSPDSRHCLRQKAGTSHCGRPEPGYRIRLQGPDAGIADARIPGVQFLQTPRTDCPPPETGRKGQAKITPKVFWVDFGNILKKIYLEFCFFGQNTYICPNDSIHGNISPYPSSPSPLSEGVRRICTCKRNHKV